MAYLTYEDYKKLAFDKNNLLDEDTFDSYEIYAEAVVDGFTFDVISKESWMLNDTYYSSKIKNAVCRQIEFMSNEESSISEYEKKEGSNVSSYSVSVGGTSESVSYNSTSDFSNFSVGGVKIAPLAVSLLSKLRAKGRYL